MTTAKEYKLPKQPLYPIPELIQHIKANNQEYNPDRFPYDNNYNDWIKAVKGYSKIEGSPSYPITREISQIVRLKKGGQEYILYYEILTGKDYYQNPLPFTHKVGKYKKPLYRKQYNYRTGEVNTIPLNKKEIVYTVKYSKKLINELYKYAIEGKDIQLLIKVGDRSYGGGGFYTLEEFRDLSLEELARIGREGKNMFARLEVKIPDNTLAKENFELNTTPQTKQSVPEPLEIDEPSEIEDE